MTTPNIFADGYTNSEDAFLNAPSGQSDGPRLVARSATVPDSTSAGSVIGLIPFNKGFRLSYGSALAVDDLDTGTDVEIEWGYVYDNDTAFTNDPDAFRAASTIAQTAAVGFPTARGGATFEAVADGWVTVTTSGGSTTTEGVISINAIVSYQG